MKFLVMTALPPTMDRRTDPQSKGSKNMNPTQDSTYTIQMTSPTTSLLLLTTHGPLDTR